MIEVRDLSKRYGDKLAVDQLTFTVRPGMVTGFLGPNGAGKSTTMRMILGLDRPSGGLGRRSTARPIATTRRPLREVGAILEARAIHTGRSAYTHLVALGQTHGIPRSRVDEVIDLVGLQDVARKRVGTFSLGMGQRLGHRRGAARRPEDADPRRAVERPRPRGHPLDPQPAALARRRGPHGLRVVAPDERDEHDGRLADRRRPRAPDRRHDRRGLRPARIRRRRARSHARRGAAALAGGGGSTASPSRTTDDGDESALSLAGHFLRSGRRARRGQHASCCTSSRRSRHRSRRRSCA